jgi:hypothetical protein
MRKVDGWIGMLALHARRQHLVAQRESGFQEAGSARGPFQVADVRFNRPESDGTRRQLRFPEDIGHALHFDDVADARGRAVPFDQRHSRGR